MRCVSQMCLVPYGSLHLAEAGGLGMFGIRTGWLVATNMAEAARGTEWMGAVRQGHLYH
jgi:hypothetical protein